MLLLTVYAEKTGDEDDTYFTLYHVLSNEEFDDVDFEFDWDEDDEEGLKKMFPKLWEMFQKLQVSQIRVTHISPLTLRESVHERPLRNSLEQR